MAKTVSILTGGNNNHPTSSAEVNGLATDFISEGIVGAVTPGSGSTAPMTGGMAVNAQGTPNATTQVTAGVAYVTGTPSGGTSQTFRCVDDSGETIAHSANSTGGTVYDFIYIKLDPDKLANPAVNGDDVFTYVTSRSTSSSSDTGTPPTYGYLIAVVTLANGFTTIANSNITDKRSATGATAIISDGGVTAAKLATSAIALAFTAATTTTGITAVADITNSSTTVTIPAGGRKVLIHAWCQVSSATGNTGPVLTINAGGADVASNAIFMPTGGTGNYIMTTWVETPSAGSRTYKLRGSSNNSTSFSSPYMLVMVI